MVKKNTASETRTAPARVRMSDIAAKAGVSRAAVSLVLNHGQRDGSLGVSEKTAECIRRIAQQLKYNPNHAAQQLAGKPSGVVAALAGLWLDQTQLRLLSWLNEAARKRGLEVLTGQIDQKMPFEQYV